MAKYTYMLYLVHYSVWEFIKNFAIDPAVNLIIGIFLSNIIAIILYVLLEKPLYAALWRNTHE